MPKKTPWFPGHVKPVRPGVYEIQVAGGGMPWFRRWDGEKWYCGAFVADWAEKERFAFGDIPGNRWRGLVKP